MKSIICCFVIVIAVLIACTPKTAPTTGAPVPPVPGNEPVTGTVALPDPASVDSLAFLADMHAGQEIYTTKCTKCHDQKPVEHWTVEEWKPILKSMIKKSKLDSLGGHQVTVYVNANAKKS